MDPPRGRLEAPDDRQRPSRPWFIDDKRVNPAKPYDPDAPPFLLAAKKVDEAVALFELNAKLHPNSSNVYDSLGEALLARGDRNGAAANYRKSLALDPKNANAAAVLKKLGVTE